MIEIYSQYSGQLTISDNYDYTREEYETLLSHLMELAHDSNDPLAIEAKGIHLERICEHYTGIMKPSVLPEFGFVWCGDSARNILANIVLALENDVTVVVETAADQKYKLT